MKKVIVFGFVVFVIFFRIMNVFAAPRMEWSTLAPTNPINPVGEQKTIRNDQVRVELNELMRANNVAFIMENPMTRTQFIQQVRELRDHYVRFRAHVGVINQELRWLENRSNTRFAYAITHYHSWESGTPTSVIIVNNESITIIEFKDPEHDRVTQPEYPYFI